MHFKKQFIEAIVRHHVTLKKRRAELAAQFKEAVVQSVLSVKSKRIFSQRRFERRPNYDQSTWGLMLANPRSQDPSDKKGGQLFRRRFRVPFSVYLEVLAMTRTSGWFTEGRDAIGLMAAPLELKVLGVLRVLGRGYCFDGVEELCFISAEVLRTFFHKFCACFAAKYFSVYCSPPDTVEEIKHTTDVYARMGLPGCIGSTDCVHIRWERCPAGGRTGHKGKEGYPTLSYEVTVDHSKRIMAATQGHPGARNDKTIVKFDGFVTALHDGTLYNDVVYDLLDKDGVPRQQKGLYLIVDGGYHKWRCMQCPMKHTSKIKEALWSKWVESVRKDVECCFGILKGRFRCLKLPIYYQSKDVIDNIFFTCCILHNILLNVDGYDSRWEENVNWKGMNGHHADEDLTIFKKHWKRAENLVGTTDYTLQGVNAINNRYDIFHDGGEEVQDSHFILRSKLVEHYNMKYQAHEIEWLT